MSPRENHFPYFGDEAMERLSRFGIRRMTVVALFAGFVAIACVAVPQETSAATFVKAVRGNVYDSLSNPIEGANVTVVVKDGETVTATYYYDETTSEGYYQVTIAAVEWNVGYTIEVTAKFGAAEDTETVVADGEPFQTVDVTVPMVIPEFGGLLGSSVAFITVVMIAMFVIIRRTRR